MNFKKENYNIVKNVLKKDVCDLAYNYLILKPKVANYFFEKKFISEFDQMHGVWNDAQIPNTYSLYGDILMETF